MTKKQQFDHKTIGSDTDQKSLAKNLLTLGAVAIVTAALAAKAALATLEPTDGTQVVNAPSISAPHLTTETSADFEVHSQVSSYKTSDQIVSALKTAQPFNSATISNDLGTEQSRTSAVSKETVALARAVPATAQLVPSAKEKQSARSSLTHHLAKLKLRRALLAAQEASKKDPIEVSPTEGAVVAEGSAPAETPELQQQDEPITLAAVTKTEERQEEQDLAATNAKPRLLKIDEDLPAIDAPIQLASIAPTEILPVPGKRPKPLVRTKPVVAEKPGAISKPRQTARANTKPREAKPAPVLSYASPQDPRSESGAFSGLGKLFSGRKAGLPGRGSGIAVYDISAAVVHMPDGTKLEAHSGIGHRKDNPKYAYVKNLGPTPPNIYKLRMRERLFHGVEAIRMLPVDRAAMKGRDGMLAHTPLLRRTNGSHGCVAFKNYNKFLKAFKAGKVKTMIVVPSMEKLPTYMAKLNRSKRG